MTLLRRAATAMTVAGALATAAMAQAPPAPSGNARAAATTGPRRLAPTPQPSYRRSIVHHNPYPYPNFYHNDATAGFRNPGGTGRYREYYPANDQFQLDHERDPVRVAHFDQGGGAPDRA